MLNHKPGRMAADVVGDLPSSFPKHRVCALGGQSSESNGMKEQRVRIQPRALCIPKNNPFKHDRLEHRKSVEVLTGIVSRIEGPCVLAFDAPWGYGKTTFLNMWEAWLRQEGPGLSGRCLLQCLGDRFHQPPVSGPLLGVDEGTRILHHDRGEPCTQHIETRRQKVASGSSPACRSTGTWRRGRR